MIKKIIYTIVYAVVFNTQLTAQNTAEIQITNGLLSFHLNSNKGNFTIIDKKCNREWTSAPYKKIAFINAETIQPTQLKMSMYDSTCRMNFSGLVTLTTDSSISFLIDATDKAAEIDQLSFPPVITTSYTKGSLIFCYRSGGLMLAQNDTAYPVRRMMVYDNIGLDMPWIGVFDELKGDGMMLLAETPYDAEIDLDEQGQNLMWPKMAWAPTKLKFGYTRKATYIFTASGNYVSLAKAYRNYLKTTGDFKTLADKAITKPRVEWLKGSAIVWGSTGLKFAEQAHAAGVKRLIVMGHTKGVELPAITKLGYLTSEYENLEGTREGPMGFMKDTMSIAAYHTAQGKPIIGWVTKKGVEYYSRSSVRSLKALKNYIPPLLKEFAFTGRFMDVSPAFILDDYHPAHSFNRQADKEYKVSMMEYLGNELGLVVGGEHGKAWNAAKLDYLEGPMTGSFFWEVGNKPGYLAIPTDTNYMSQHFKKYGDNFKVRIPLWQLVFNDCISSSWYWGDSNDWFTNINPEKSEQRDALNILYGTMPLLWANQNGYGWDRHQSRFLQTLRNVCNFQERVSFSELLEHQFINEAHTLQQTKFKNGAQVFINVSNQPIACKIDDQQMLLAPNGFYATAPGFMQSKTIDKKGMVTILESDSLFSVETDSLRSIGAVTTKGRVTAYKISEKCWRLITETPGANSIINLNALTKNNKLTYCSLWQLTNVGRQDKQIAAKVDTKKIQIAAGPGIRIFELRWK